MALKTANGQQETLGKLITGRLLELGWSNAELARRTGFSTTYIGNLAKDIAPGTKTGKPKRIPDETVERIAKALQVPIDRARAAAGLAKKEYFAPDTIEEALETASYFEHKGLNESDREELRPVLKIADREVERILSHPRHAERTKSSMPKVLQSAPRKRDKIDEAIDNALTKGGKPVSEANRKIVREALEKLMQEKSQTDE